MGLIADVGAGPVAIDTSIFIYFIEDHPVYAPALVSLFDAIDAGRVSAVTSGVTLLEVLVAPLRAGNVALAERYEDVVTRSRGLRIVELDRPLLRVAAHLRARYSTVRTPDALQLAAALSAGCSTFLTNDRDLPALPGLEVLQLKTYVAGS